MRSTYPQPESKARVIAAVRAGAAADGWGGDLPPYRTVLRWVRGDPGFAAALARAQGKRGAAWWGGSRETYDRDAVRGRVLEAVRGGAGQSNWPAGIPGHLAVWRWARADAAFAGQLRAARAHWRGVQGEGRMSQRAYSYDKRDAFLAAVRAGDTVRALTRRAFPGPDRETLAVWLRMDGWFAQEYARAKRAAAAGRKTRPLMAFDWDVADAVIVAMSKGRSLPEIHRTPGMPGRRAMAVWRVQEPDFASALKIARRVCLSVRKRARAQTPEVVRRVMDHIEEGGSLLGAGRLAGVPRHETLYAWKRRSAAFREELRWAEKFRTERLDDEAMDRMEVMDLEGVRAIEARLGRLRGGNRPKEG